MNEQLKPICPVERCTGCMACVNSCAHSAIVVEEDSLGFKYPKIDVTKCTGCGLCESVCPEFHPRKLVFPERCYAAAVKSSHELMTCASGGAATALAQALISRGGVACGCTGVDFPYARHIIVESVEDLEKLKGSKYVQSDIDPGLMRNIRQLLIGGREVLFIGTGCQVAGLLNFLRKPYDNLTTVDLVCHGVPSQKMLADNMSLYKNLEPSSIRFREKRAESDGFAIRFGWSATSRIDESVRPIFVKWNKDPYLAAFMTCLSFRPCCYDCRYAYAARQSDLTICDFWGLGRDSKLARSCGVSAILINTERGFKTFDSARSLMEVEERTVREAVAGNGQLLLPSRRNPERAKFELLYRTHGFKHACKMTAMRQLRVRFIREAVSRMVKAPFRLLIK